MMPCLCDAYSCVQLAALLSLQNCFTLLKKPSNLHACISSQPCPVGTCAPSPMQNLRARKVLRKVAVGMLDNYRQDAAAGAKPAAAGAAMEGKGVYGKASS